MQELQPVLRAMKTTHTDIGRGVFANRGFSLIELLIVIAILGILSAVVGVSMNAADAKLRSEVFNLASRFKQAKYEAMKRGRNVYLDFDFDANTVIDSYTLWVDNDGDGGYVEWDPAADDDNGNGVCDVDEGDCTIGPPAGGAANAAVPFSQGMALYDASDATITGGPKDSAGGSGDADIEDGLKLGGDAMLQFRPSGDTDNGSIYLYVPGNVAGGKEVTAGPMAIVINNVGRVQVDEWRYDKNWVND